MKTAGKVVLAAVVGVVIGAVGMRAQEKRVAPGFVVAELEVTDQAAFQKYSSQVTPTVAAFGGHYVVRGGAVTPLEGQAPKRVVVLQFDSAEKAKAWYDSPTYHGLIPMRQSSTKDAQLFVVEGVSP
jgi:uncharacterized protein (DUF1330 family)